MWCPSYGPVSLPKLDGDDQDAATMPFRPNAKVEITNSSTSFETVRRRLPDLCYYPSNPTNKAEIGGVYLPKNIIKTLLLIKPFLLLHHGAGRGVEFCDAMYGRRKESEYVQFD